MGLYPYGGLAEPVGARAWSYIIPTEPRTLAGKVRMLFSLVRWLRQERPELIISAMPAANVLLALLGRFVSPTTSLVLTHHSPTHVYRKLLSLLDRWGGVGSNVKAIVCVSETVRLSLDGMPPAYRAKLRVIKNSLPPAIDAHIAGLVANREPRKGPISVVACGRLEEVKNHAMLLRALARVPNMEARIIGSGHLEDALKSLARDLGIADRVNFLGNQSREDALTLMAGADIFVQMSLFEGHSLALIEAAKLGMPLVVSDFPGQIEGIVSQDGGICGLVVPLDKDDVLVQVLTELANDTDLRRDWSRKASVLGQQASFAHMIAQYLAVVDAAAPLGPGEQMAGTSLHLADGER